MKNDKHYQFIYLVAGNLGYKSADPLLEPNVPWPGISRKRTDPHARLVTVVQSPIGSGTFPYSAEAIAGIESAYTKVCFHAQNDLLRRSIKVPEKDTLMTDNRYRTLFARIVSSEILLSRNLNQTQYQLVITYERIRRNLIQDIWGLIDLL